MRRIAFAALACACVSDPPDAAQTSESTTSGAVDTTTTSSSTTDPATTQTTNATTSSADTTTSTGVEESSSSESGVPDDPGPDLRMPGPHAVTTSEGSATTTSCTMQYAIATPRDVPDAPFVVLAHGFQGNRGSMVDWAEHYASWGLAVVTPDLCHATIADADHASNGADLVALAAELGIASPIYAGYSAGGLASVLAAAQDPNAIALVGLDMVDSGGLGADVAAGVAIPAHDITSEPSMCNSTANGVPVFDAMADSNTVRIVEADHCDFQSPGDAFCGLCSAPNPEHTTESIQSAIRGLSTGALLWRAGVDPRGASWWTPGGLWYDELFTAGAVVQL
ncbi:MAG TPA: alpha/beta hydrolase [Nannocystaceae bacterium]|nr:alpha/beta hydrolase [Nannocystaceae bacterium]